jgi:hypothetical protein
MEPEAEFIEHILSYAPAHRGHAQHGVQVILDGNDL